MTRLAPCGGVSLGEDNAPFVHQTCFGEVQLAPRQDAWDTVFNADVQPNRSYVLHISDGGHAATGTTKQ
jgi:hypothetical protein